MKSSLNSMNSENSVNNVNTVNSVYSMNRVCVARCCLHLLWYFLSASPPLISTKINKCQVANQSSCSGNPSSKRASGWLVSLFSFWNWTRGVGSWKISLYDALRRVVLACCRCKNCWLSSRVTETQCLRCERSLWRKASAENFLIVRGFYRIHN